LSAPDLFISYSHQDREIARRYADATKAGGVVGRSFAKARDLHIDDA
jgi:hypothetical protein